MSAKDQNLHHPPKDSTETLFKLARFLILVLFIFSLVAIIVR